MVIQKYVKPFFKSYLNDNFKYYYYLNTDYQYIKINFIFWHGVCNSLIRNYLPNNSSNLKTLNYEK